MKDLKSFSIILALALHMIFYSCETTSTSYTGSSLDSTQIQQVIIWAEHNNDSISYTDVEGLVTSNSMRTLELDYIKLEDTKYINYIHQGNYLSFSDFRIYSPPETINIEAKTSQGTLTGQTTLPQSPNNITTNISDTIGLNDSLQISWAEGQAEDYNIIAGYYYTIDKDTAEGIMTKNTTIDTVVHSNSITLSSDKFQYNGILYDLNIKSINTPGEKEGEQGFMEIVAGKGEGYIYYLSDEINIAKNIIVGSGAPNQKLAKQTVAIETKNRIMNSLK